MWHQCPNVSGFNPSLLRETKVFKETVRERKRDCRFEALPFVWRGGRKETCLQSLPLSKRERERDDSWWYHYRAHTSISWNRLLKYTLLCVLRHFFCHRILLWAEEDRGGQETGFNLLKTVSIHTCVAAAVRLFFVGQNQMRFREPVALLLCFRQRKKTRWGMSLLSLSDVKTKS